MATGAIVYDTSANPWLANFLDKRVPQVLPSMYQAKALVTVTTPELRQQMGTALGFDTNTSMSMFSRDLLQHWNAVNDEPIGAFLNAMRDAGLAAVVNDTLDALYSRAVYVATANKTPPPVAVRDEPRRRAAYAAPPNDMPTAAAARSAPHVWFTYIVRMQGVADHENMNHILWLVQLNVMSDLVSYFERALPGCFEKAWRNADGTAALGGLRATCSEPPYSARLLPDSDDRALNIIDRMFGVIYDMVARAGPLDAQAEVTVAVARNCAVDRNLLDQMRAVFHASRVRVCVSENMLYNHAALMQCLFAQAVFRRRPACELVACFAPDVGDSMRGAIAMVFAPVALRGARME